MKLVSGKGSEKTGACWMSAIHWYTRGGKRSWSDQPDCVSPIIRDLCIALNDRLESDVERERIIGPHIFDPVGTSTGNEDEGKRWALCVDRAVHLFTPFWLRKTKDARCISIAESLEKLPAVTDQASAKAALPLLDKARSSASAYASAYAYAYASDREWLHAEVLKLILECCAIGRQPEERIATKSRSECLEFLCSFDGK